MDCRIGKFLLKLVKFVVLSSSTELTSSNCVVWQQNLFTKPIKFRLKLHYFASVSVATNHWPLIRKEWSTGDVYFQTKSILAVSLVTFLSFSWYNIFGCLSCFLCFSFSIFQFLYRYSEIEVLILFGFSIFV